ncbi:MAG TPA: glycoside hydrolase family 127 protein [Tepidisphaeraceae bacterium]|jgi:hypothetical protein
MLVASGIPVLSLLIGALCAAVCCAQTTAPAAVSLTKDYPVQPVPFTDVRLTDSFWAPRIGINRAVTIPHAFEKCEQTGRMDNFDRAAAALRGEDVKDKTPPGFPFDDTDIYKVLEGAAYTLSVQPDPKLKAYLDGLIAKIAAAQEPDGYLFTARTIDPANPHKWAGPQRWVNERDLSHELYNLGHLYEAAVAHYRATGERSLLNVAIKTADLLDRTFGPGKQSIWPGHQIVEMGLVKLARATGDDRYLRLAKFMLDQHGPDGGRGAGKEYNQSHQWIRDQTTAVGHAVRATYMYSGIADVAALTDDAAYLRAIDAVWANCVGRKLYITGGIGAKHQGEAFGKDYELPNLTAYNETCAAIGNVYWNHRLFLLHGDAKYIDVMERSLYNGLISGVSLDGRTFFYPNPLESAGDVKRSEWFGCACCPGNITRFMASLPGYVYAHHADTAYVNLFVSGRAKVNVAGQDVELMQETHYPWQGDVKLTVNPAKAATFAVALRVPGWARGEPVPSDLYRYANADKEAVAEADTEAVAEAVSLKVNGEPMPLTTEKGYAIIRRAWKTGDVVELSLPMPVRRVLANDKVAADRGRVAIERGPIVYCAEGVDNAGDSVRSLVLPDAAGLTPAFKPDLLGGVTVLQGTATAVKNGVTQTERPLTLIPYATWANRGDHEMTVWLPRTPQAVTTRPAAAREKNEFEAARP